MTRFARGLGSKGANERAPEQATSWGEMRNQLNDRQKNQKDHAEGAKFEAMRKQNYENFLKEEKEKATVETWCEFDAVKSSPAPEGEVNRKKKKYTNIDKKVASDSEMDEDDQELDKWCNEYSDEESTAKFKSLTSELENILSNQKKEKKKNDKNKIDDVENSSKKRKRKTTDEVDRETNIDNTESDKSAIADPTKKNKKKLKKNKSVVDEQPEIEKETDIVPEVYAEKAKKKKKTIINEEHKPQQASDTVLEVSPNKPKKKKKEKATVCQEMETEATDQVKNNDEIETNTNQKLKATNPDCETDKKKKKKNKKEPQNGLAIVQEKPQRDQKKLFQNDNKDKNTLHSRRKPINDETTVIIVNGEELEVTQFGGFPILNKDAERLKELRKNLISKGIPKSEVDRTLKLERRKAEKSLSRLKKKLCFHCRKAGHNLSECPELNSNTENTGMPTSGICFKCGSTEHTHFACRVVKTQDFKFAQCYICKEQGHISRQCPDNPKGMYPKGGACRECGDVTHLKKDCPKILQLREDHTIKLDTMEDGNIEDISNKSASIKTNVPKVKRIRF